MKLLLLLIFTVSFSSVFSQWNSDPTVNNAVAIKPGMDDGSRAVTDGANGSLIFFNSDSTQSGVGDVYAQRITADGVIAWGTAATPKGICVGTANQSMVDLISDGAGGAFLAYDEESGSTSTIRLQHVNSSGSVLWSSVGIQAAVSAESAVLCSDGSGGLIVAWDYDDNISNAQVFAQRYNSAGQPQWTSGGVQICTAPGFRASFGIVPDGASGSIIIFGDTRNSTNGTDYEYVNDNDIDNVDIYAQKLSSNGSVMWTANAKPVCTALGNQIVVEIKMAVSDGNGGAIMVFDDDRNDASTGIDIWAQKINNAGAPQWGTNGVQLSSLTGGDYTESITADGTGGVVASWFNESDSYVHSQKVNGAGTVNWPANGVKVSPDATESYNSRVVGDGAGNYIYSFLNSSGAGRKILAQKLNAAGDLQWSGNNSAVCTNTTNDKAGPSLVLSDNGGAIVTWNDDRNDFSTGWDIYASKLLSSGLLAGTANTGFTSIANGNWNSAATWAGGVVPSISSQVKVRHLVTVTANAGCYSLTVEQPSGHVVVNTGVNLVVSH